MAEESILTSTKAGLGVLPEHTAFDTEITLHINSVLSRLAQLGVGPAEGFRIEDDKATWEEFLGTDARLNAAKSYMVNRVKLLFDPPEIGFVLTAMKENIREDEWRLMEQAETIKIEQQPVVVVLVPDEPTEGGVIV